jgi:hypothetical protein
MSGKGLTTRCNELAGIVMRDGEPEGRESLIATVRRQRMT